ncbi:MAG: hypothetical protein BroJett011_59560 [Chloroflexota bacterium]|nr:MAG: hypothetical protein BroJett011_59560 [Chloroflexota bacterium]
MTDENVLLKPFYLPSEMELLEMVRQHWQKYRPQAFARLQQMGYLEESIQTAVRLTLDALSQLISYHQMDPREAWETVREEWALLPAEELAEERLMGEEALAELD